MVVYIDSSKDIIYWKVLRCDPMKLLVQFLADKGIRTADLFRPIDPEKQYRVSRKQFVQGMKVTWYQVIPENISLELIMGGVVHAR